MPTPESMVQFKAGLQSAFDEIQSKDLNTVYFVTDTQRLFVGETEYTRPVQHGADLPSGYNPPNSLFVVETGDVRDLYFSADGASWTQIAHLPATITGGVFGDSTKTVDFGGKIIVPKVTVDEHGSVTAIENATITLPQAPENAEVDVTTSGSGNVVTNVAKTPDTLTGITVTMGTLEGSGSVTGSATQFVSSVSLGEDFTLTGGTTSADTDVSTGSGIPTTSAVKSYVNTQDASTLQSAKDYADSILGANDAMVFKGTLGTGGTVTQLPQSGYQAGWTYRVVTAGTYAGQECEVGDLVIAIADYSDSFDEADWTVAQTNIDGAVISDATFTLGNVVTGVGGQKVQDSGVALSSLATTAVTNELNSKLSTAEADITSLEGRMDTAEGDINDLQSGKVDKTTTVAGKALSGNITIALEDLSNVTGSATDGQSLVFNGTNWVPGAPDAGSVSWANVQGKPTTVSIAAGNTELAFSADLTAGGAVTATGSIKAVSMDKVTGLSAALSGKVNTSITVNGQPLSSNVTITDITGTAGKVSNALTINGEEYDGSEAVEITTPNTTYTFGNGSNGNFTVTPSGGEPQTVTIGKPATAGTADAVAWSGITGRPTIIGTGDAVVTVNLLEGTVTTSITSLTASKVNGALSNATIGAASVTAGTLGTNVIAQTTTTASAGDNSTKIASTAFVKQAVDASTLVWGSF